MISINVCPKCGQVDQIQKLTAIVSAGTRRTVGTTTTSGRTNVYNRDFEYAGNAYSSSSTQVNTVARTALAQKLSPPQCPSQPIEPSDDVSIVKVAAMLFVVVLISCVILILSDSWPLFCGSFLVVSFVLGGLIGYLERPEAKRKEEHYQLMMKSYSEMLPEWERMYKQWEQMYYCYRDDVVFIPEEEAYVTPDDIAKLYIRT